ncbi:MAG: epoxyqueuosine reductase [Desulfobacterales bacterium]|nr:MAG: epoxyqueuosine reductase [Desulfobacterales bacterium]
MSRILGENLTVRIQDQLDKVGCLGKIVSIEHIYELEQQIESQYRQGLFDEEFYQEELTGFDFKIADSLSGTKSLIIVAAPQPQVRVTFNRSGESYNVIIPPTYSYETDRQIQDLLERQLNPAGFQVKKAKLPWKLLAVRSGLAQYGKNNITYVDGMGSYHRLVAFISDLHADEDHWQEPQVLERCENCKACRKACPTGAINADRFLLNGDRCLTHYNERRGEFPQWIKPSWHNCLVGCLYCQKACPVNKDVLKSVREGPVFSEEETAGILQGHPQSKIPQEAIQKLTNLDLIEYLPVLGRNLAVLLKRLSA